MPERHAAAARPDPDRAGLVLAASGALGFLLGTALASWQVAVETAQVLAGLVEYPSVTPFFIYHAKLWTILHQVSAGLLRSGLSEIAVSTLLSGAIGLVSFQALALITYALARDPLLAIGTPLLVFITGMAEFGVVYPVVLLGFSHTYGVFGLSFTVLGAALLGAGWYRAGAFCLGLAPAVHPSLGVWSVAVGAAAAVWDLRQSRGLLRTALPYFVAGAALSAASLGLHLLLQPPLPEVEPAVAARYLEAFVSFWDAHRAPVNPRAAGVAINIGVLILTQIWLRWFAADLPRPATYLLRYLAISTAVALGVAALSHVPPGRLPTAMVILMPSRWLNVAVLAAVALLLGLVGAYSRRPGGRLLAAGLAAALLLVDRSWLWREPAAAWMAAWRIDSALGLLALASGGLLVLALLGRRRPPPAPSPAARVVSSVAVVLLASAASLTAVLSYVGTHDQMADAFREAPSDNRLFAGLGVGHGVLLTGGDLHLVQLRTRRPVLIDGGGLDGLPYALESAPQLDRILRDVYGIDLVNPPEEARGGGRIPTAANRAHWETVPLDRWRQIRAEYGVTEVLTRADWTLHLPTKARSANYQVYAIPE